MNYTTTQFVAKEGWKYIATTFALFLFTLIIDADILQFFTFLLFAFTVFIFRNPERIAKEDDDYAFLSPCDGKITRIEKVYEQNFIKDNVLLICIDMNILDTPLLRAPLDMEIEKIEQKHGLFLPNSDDKSGVLNEAVALLGKTRFGFLLIRQKAGFFSRKIDVFKGLKTLKKGARYSLMIDGRVELYLPVNARTSVVLYDRVRGGESILGYFETNSR